MFEALVDLSIRLYLHLSFIFPHHKFATRIEKTADLPYEDWQSRASGKQQAYTL
jgi:hypothetical protein